MKKEIESELTVASKYIGISSLYFIVGYPLSMIVSLIIAKKVGAENLGLISIYLSFMQILTFISVFGTNTGSTKYIAQFLEFKNYTNIKRVIIFSLLFPLVTMAVTLGIYFTFDSQILSFLFPNTPQLIQILRVFIFFLPVFVFKQSLIGILRGMQRPHYDRIEQSIIYPISRIALLFLFFVFFGIFYSLLLATVLSFLVGVIFMYIKLKKETGILKESFNNNTSSLSLKEYLYFSLPLVLIPLVNLAISSIDTMIISQYLEANNIGIYSIVKRFGLLVSIPLSLSSPMIASTVSKMFSQNKMNDFGSIYMFITKWSVFIGSILFSIIFIYSKDLLLFIGEDFVQGEIALKIFAFSQLLIVLIGPIGYVLIMANKKTYFIIYSYISVIIGFISMVLLTPDFGLLGSIISISLIYIITNFLCLTTLISKYKISPMTIKHLLSRLTIIAIAILAHHFIFIQTNFLLNMKILSIICGSIFIIICISTYYFLIEKLEKEDHFIISKIKIYIKNEF